MSLASPASALPAPRPSPSQPSSRQAAASRQGRQPRRSNVLGCADLAGRTGLGASDAKYMGRPSPGNRRFGQWMVDGATWHVRRRGELRSTSGFGRGWWRDRRRTAVASSRMRTQTQPSEFLLISNDSPGLTLALLGRCSTARPGAPSAPARRHGFVTPSRARQRSSYRCQWSVAPIEETNARRSRAWGPLPRALGSLPLRAGP